MNLDKPLWYEIRLAGHLSPGWSDWFEGLAIQNEINDETVLRGPFLDQAALLGTLTRLQALNLRLIAVNQLPAPE